MIPLIECSVPLPTSDCPLPSVERRYYDRYFAAATEEGSSDGRQCVLLHSNRICLVTLAPEHPVIRDKKKILKVNFQVSERLNRLSNEVRGKGKKGGQTVDASSILAWIECEGGEKFAVRSHVRGKLVEINERLVECPELLAEKPMGEGYVAIILPKLPDGLDEMKQRLSKTDLEVGATVKVE